MRVLVYKRTHIGDPDENGWFGVSDCMGAVRKRDFDAVVGVGGIGSEPRSHGIDRKLNWIGIGPHIGRKNNRAPMLRFDHFHYFGTSGDLFSSWAPRLARRMYWRGARHLMSDSMNDLERKEIEAIVRLARHAPPSSDLPRHKRPCPPKICKSRGGGC